MLDTASRVVTAPVKGVADMVKPTEKASSGEDQ